MALFEPPKIPGGALGVTAGALAGRTLRELALPFAKEFWQEPS